ncbi:MAG TPA: hypothetical protein PLT54_09075 [Rhodoferax sp.]|jgi:vacuolar-type H+-ATPase subunit I/STV1|nr:hypothetical protein [Rhodoferax sp.]
MAFFKKYNGTTNARLVRLERLIWVLIYGGLLSVVLAMFVEKTQAQDAGALYTGGALAVLAGAILIYVRSRMREEN